MFWKTCSVFENGAWPIQVAAFAAHLGEGRGVAVHPVRHEVAADAGQRAAALRHLGRGVVRAAGAEIGDALDRRLRSS